MNGFSVAFIMLCICGYAGADEMPLYPTGPEEDSAFVRFVNAGGNSLVVSSGHAKTVLSVAKPYTGYISVVGSNRVDGVLSQQGGKKKAVSLQPTPGEFVTVIAMSKNGEISTTLLRETPDEFNGLKASIGFADMSAGSCSRPTLKVDGREVTLFQQVLPATLQRRMINPVRLKVQLLCSGKQQGVPVDLGQLVAGERYSVLVLPSDIGARLIFLNDQLVQ